MVLDKKGTYRVFNPAHNAVVECDDFWMVGTGIGSTWVFEKDGKRILYFPVQNTIIEKIK